MRHLRVVRIMRATHENAHYTEGTESTEWDDYVRFAIYVVELSTERKRGAINAIIRQTDKNYTGRYLKQTSILEFV